MPPDRRTCDYLLFSCLLWRMVALNVPELIHNCIYQLEHTAMSERPAQRRIYNNNNKKKRIERREENKKSNTEQQNEAKNEEIKKRRKTHAMNEMEK